MKKITLVVLSLLILCSLPLTAWAVGFEDVEPDAWYGQAAMLMRFENALKPEEPVQPKHTKIIVNGQVFTGELYDNDVAHALGLRKLWVLAALL